MEKILIVKHGNLKERKVALTFDDGPNPYITPKILDILKEETCRASFFLIGKWAGKHPSLVKRILKEGHVIGGHTQNHSFYSNGRDLCNDMITGIETIEKISEKKIKYIRFPRFRYRPIGEIDLEKESEKIQKLFEEIENKEKIIIDSTINPHDWNPEIKPQEILNFICSNISNSCIIALHDSSEDKDEFKARPLKTLKLLPKVIKGLKDREFELVNLDRIYPIFTQKIFYEEK